MADRYWVGGTASWDGTAGTKWAATSGGAGGASVPTSADDVFFDANSGTGVATVVTGNTGAKSINCTGYTGTLVMNSNFSLAGSITLSAGMTYTATSGTITITQSGTIITAGKTFSAFSVNGAGITVQLGDALNLGSNTISVALGTFTTNNFNVTAGSFLANNSSTKTFNLGSSVITLTNTGVCFSVGTGATTFNAGTSTFVLTNVGVTLQVTGVGGLTFNNVSFTNTTSTTASIQGTNTFNNLSVTAPASAGVTQVSITANQTINGTLSTNGTAGNRRVWFRSDTYGVRRTLTINSAPSLTDVDFRDIIVNGTAAPISGTRIGNRGACAGITFSAPKTVYWNLAAGGNWSDNAWATSSGGGVSTDNFPLPQDTAVIGNTGLNSSATVTLNSALAFVPTVNMSTRTNAMTISNGTGTTVYGSWINGNGTTVGGGNGLTFSGEGTKTITSAGKQFVPFITIDAYGGIVELTDALSLGGELITVTNGTFDTKNYNVTAGRLSSSNSNVRFISLGSSTVTLSSSTAIDFSTSTGLTFNAGTSQINPTFAQFGSGATINATNITFNNVAFASTAASTNLTHTLGGSGGNTFNNLSMNTVAAGLSKLVVTGNQTINGTLTCTSANNVSRCMIQSATFGTPVTLTVASISAPSTNFRDITLAGSAAGFAPTYGGDCGGNSGIVFPSPKSVYWNLSGSQQFTANGWAATSGGTPNLNNYPLPQDTAVFDNTGAAGTVTCGDGTGAQLPAIDLSARTSAMTFDFFLNGGHECYGGFTNSSSGSVSVTAGIGANVYRGRGTQTFTSAGKTITFPITADSFSGTFQLGDALNSSNSLTLSSGTFDAVSYNVTTTTFTSTNFNALRTLKMGSGLWTLSGTGTVWNISSSTLTMFAGTANILLSNNTTSSRSFSGGNLFYNKLTIGGDTSTSTTTISGSNTFAELASTKTVAHTIALGSDNQTFGKWSVTGTAGNVVTLTGSGTTHRLAGSATSGIDYLAMGSIAFASNSTAEFYAGANSTGTAGAPVFRTVPPSPRTLYWVGGTGNWGDTARWSLSSGGAGGEAVPTSADDVVFDSASSATSYTVTVNDVTVFRCNNFTISAPASGSISFNGASPTLIIHGNLTFPASGMIRNYTGDLIFSGSTSGKTITTNGVSLFSAITFNGVGAGWTLGSAFNNTTRTVTIVNGSFDTGNFNLTCNNLFSSYSSTRSISLGSSTVNLSLSGSDTIQFLSSGNLTFNAGTSQINMSGGSATLRGSGQTFYNVAFTSGVPGGKGIVGANTFNNLSITTTAQGVSQITTSSNQIITGTLTCAGTSPLNRGGVRSDTIGRPVTFTVGTLVANDADFRDVTIAGAAAGTAPTRAGDCGGNTGIIFPAPKTVYRVTNNGSWFSSNSWALTSGGAGSDNNFPLAQDTAIFDNATTPVGYTLAFTNEVNIGTLDSSARTLGITFNYNSSTIVYGNYIFGSGTSVQNATSITFAGRGTQTISLAGKTLNSAIRVEAPGGTFQLGAALTTAGTITHVLGTFDAVTYNLTCSTFDSSNSNIRTLNMGSGLWTLTGTGTVWSTNNITNLTFNKGTANILLSDTSSNTRQMFGGNLSFNKFTIGGSTGTSTFTFNGSNTFTEIASTKIVAHTIALGTTTQRVGAFTVTGTVGNVVTITGNTSNLIYTGGGTITGLDYLNVQGRVYGSAGQITDVWYAGANSVNSGSLGWEFRNYVPPPLPLNPRAFFLMFA